VRSRRTGRWLRGSFSSASAAERAEVVDDSCRAIDLAAEVSSARISTCPLNAGHDYVFEMDYLDACRYAEETFAAICAHNPQLRVCIEYKWNDPRTRCLFASAGETLAFSRSVGAENLGVTLDLGHALLAGERPAQSVALLARADRLFYVHLNDNDRHWDWDMIPGAFNVWDTVEFFCYLKEVGYTDDWYAYDVMSREIDTLDAFNVVTRLTRKRDLPLRALQSAWYALSLRARPDEDWLLSLTTGAELDRRPAWQHRMASADGRRERKVRSA